MAYTVLARKYRSQGFDDVIGQQPIAQTLKNAIKTGRVAHAFLFTGTRGIGKTTMARVLAKALNCQSVNEPTTEPCCKCESCLAINAGQDVDVIEIDGASNRGIDNIRELRQNAIYRPARSRYKIYIIDEVHMLTTEAFNALLKTLEEPPEHVKFIFATTEPNKVLPTIQSRCQRYDFTNIDAQTIAERLRYVLDKESIKYEEDIVLTIARMANGSMRDGLSLLDRLISTGVEPLTSDLLQQYMGCADSAKVIDLIEKIADSDAAGALNSIDELITSGLGEVQVVDSLVDYMRDLMIAKSAGPESRLLILNADQRKRLAELAGKFDIAALIYNITTLEKLRWPIKNSDAPRPLLEAGILRFALAEHFMNVDELLTGLQGTAQKKTEPLTKPPQASPSASTPKPAGAQPAKATAKTADKPVATIEAEDFDSLKAKWPQLTEALKKALGPGTFAPLSTAEPLDFEDNVITLGFAPSAELSMNMCQSNGREDLIRQAFSQSLGRDIKLQMQLTDSDKKKTDTEPKQNKSKGNGLIEDPAVKMILTEFEGTITGIQEDRQN